jgi:hypothetical protein
VIEVGSGAGSAILGTDPELALLEAEELRRR